MDTSNNLTKVYVLSNYNFVPGILVKTNKTTCTVRFKASNFCSVQESSVKKEKIAFPNELVAVVWETWKGKNGRGGYRIERELYPQWRVPASQVSYQEIGHGKGRITETAYGVGST